MTTPADLPVIPEDQYHRETGLGEGLYVTRSMLLDYQESPRGFYLRHVLRHPLAKKTWNTGMGLGTIVDLMLSGEADRVIAVPDEHLTPSGNLSTKKATLAWLEERDAAGEAPADPATLHLAELLCEESRRHPICMRLIERTTHQQVTLRWQDEETGLWLQTRPDRLADGLCWADDKTTRKPLRSFMTAVDEYGYDLQQVMAMDGAAALGLPALPFVFLAMQTSYPFDVGVLRLEPRVIENAYGRYRAALKGIAAQQYGSTDSDLRSLTVPYWWDAKRETAMDPEGITDA